MYSSKIQFLLNCYYENLINDKVGDTIFVLVLHDVLTLILYW